MYKRVSVFGGGSFGTALATLCARQGMEVRLWMRNEARATAINAEHRNPDYLADFELAPTIRATTDVKEAVADTEWMILVVPSHGIRDFLRQHREQLPEVPLVLGTKGIENESLMTMAEVVSDVLGDAWDQRTLALSGPSFAKEIMQGFPTAVVLASLNEKLADRIARMLFCDSFRAYTTNDVTGVEMGGAMKNVMAIAAGGLAGLGFGDNSRAALVTRGVAEITRVAVAKGANPLTLAGLAGVGDLVLTCTGSLSRNRAIGQALGEGLSLDEAIRKVQQVAEGVRTTASAKALVDRLKIYAPITNAVYKVLYENRPVQEALLEVVRREPGREREHDI